jgi:hypothetical protein
MKNDERFSRVNMELPNLKELSGIQPANILAGQPIYVAAQLERLNIFSVVDRLIELFQSGQLSIGNSARRMLDDYRKKNSSRMTSIERRNVYARAFGVDKGSASSVTPNREFNDLWVRFVSAVSAFVRQLPRGKPVSAQLKVKKPARELAQNLSLHGYGVGYFAARELQTQINEMVAILSHPDIRSVYGAATMWQVIEQVAVSDLGGAVNTVRYRTTAMTGAIIIAWLAQRSSVLASTKRSTVLDVKQISGSAHSPKPTSKPNDRDLSDACEQWLAVTGTPDEKMADAI